MSSVALAHECFGSSVNTPLFLQKGRTSFIIGGQWGSEAKGSASAWLAQLLAKEGQHFDIAVSGAGAQAGHTSVHMKKRRVLFHLPTAPLITADILGEPREVIYLSSGSVIDPEVLMQELELWKGEFYIHPMASVITDECKAAELQQSSPQTKIASTRKGVGEALARKIRREGLVARDHPDLRPFVRRIDLNARLNAGMSVLVEVPQGVSLSLSHSPFYPHTTSRDCTPASAMAEAGIHPKFYNQTMVVLRTFPIRVGNIVENGKEVGTSGGCYPDQHEVSWEDLGVEAEITTVTKRIRRVFTWSNQQIINTFALCRPEIVFLSFCNYVKDKQYFAKIHEGIKIAAKVNRIPEPKIIYEFGPTTDDVASEYNV